MPDHHYHDYLRNNARYYLEQQKQAGLIYLAGFYSELPITKDPKFMGEYTHITATKILELVANNFLNNEENFARLNVVGFSRGMFLTQKPKPTDPEAIELARELASTELRFIQTNNIVENYLKELLYKNYLGPLRGIRLEDPTQHISVSFGSSLEQYEIAIKTLSNETGNKYVLIPTPYFPGIKRRSETSNTRSHIITTKEPNHKLTPALLEQHITALGKDNICCLNLTTPINPLFSDYTTSELEGLAKVCIKHDIPIVLDELYTGLDHDPATRKPSLASMKIMYDNIEYDMGERVIVIDGSSKKWMVGEDGDVKIGFSYTKNKNWASKIAEMTEELDTVIGSTYATIIEHYGIEHLQSNSNLIKENYQHLVEQVIACNKSLGFYAAQISTCDSCFMCTLSIDEELCKKHKINSGSDLQLLLATQESSKVMAQSTSAMGISKPTVRINFMNKEDITRAFQGITKLLIQMRDRDKLPPAHGIIINSSI